MNKKLEALISLGLIGAVCVGGYLSNRNGKPIIEKDKDFDIHYVDESFCKDPYIKCTVVGESGTFLDYLEKGEPTKNLWYAVDLTREDNGEICKFYVMGSWEEYARLSREISVGTVLNVHRGSFTEESFFDKSKREGYLLARGLNIISKLE